MLSVSSYSTHNVLLHNDMDNNDYTHTDLIYRVLYLNLILLLNTTSYLQRQQSATFFRSKHFSLTGFIPVCKNTRSVAILVHNKYSFKIDLSLFPEGGSRSVFIEIYSGWDRALVA